MKAETRETRINEGLRSWRSKRVCLPTTVNSENLLFERAIKIHFIRTRNRRRV